jgi:hypothetical protein
VVGVVVPLMLVVLPYARGRGFDSRSRLLLYWLGGNGGAVGHLQQQTTQILSFRYV